MSTADRFSCSGAKLKQTLKSTMPTKGAFSKRPRANKSSYIVAKLSNVQTLASSSFNLDTSALNQVELKAFERFINYRREHVKVGLAQQHIVSTTAAVTSAITGIVGSIAMGVLNANAKNALKYYQGTTTNIGIATNIAKSQNNTTNPRVNALIYHPYEVLAEGSIYKDGAPGSVSYVGIESFNPMRGILGTKVVNVLGERINNRAHRHMAGNAYYDGLNLDTPKAQHNPFFSLAPKGVEWLKTPN